MQVLKPHRGTRYQILSADSQDGIVLSRIFKGTTDAVGFKDLIEQLLQRCGQYPAEGSVLVMDNGSLITPSGIEQLCTENGVELVYLSPYLPDLNPIEKFFAELKAFIKRHWSL
jgi:transposase